MPRPQRQFLFTDSPLRGYGNITIRTADLGRYDPATGQRIDRKRYIVTDQHGTSVYSAEEALELAREIHAQAATIIAERQSNGEHLD